jgi:hypothetical protein
MIYNTGRLTLLFRGEKYDLTCEIPLKGTYIDDHVQILSINPTNTNMSITFSKEGYTYFKIYKKHLFEFLFDYNADRLEISISAVFNKNEANQLYDTVKLSIYKNDIINGLMDGYTDEYTDSNMNYDISGDFLSFVVPKFKLFYP